MVSSACPPPISARRSRGNGRPAAARAAPSHLCRSRAPTPAQYQQHVQRHINPRIGEIKLAHLTPTRIETFRDELLANLSRPMARKVMTSLRSLLKAAERDPKRGVTILKTEYAADYWQRRQKLIGLAEYVAVKTKDTRPDESAAAHELAEALKVDRV